MIEEEFLANSML